MSRRLCPTSFCVGCRVAEATTDVGPGIANPGRTRSACKSDRPDLGPRTRGSSAGRADSPSDCGMPVLYRHWRPRSCWVRSVTCVLGTQALQSSGRGDCKPLLPSFEGQATLTDARAADMMAGLWYLNIHTARYPGGETRGQLELVK